jgi:hypothetical protein
VVSTVAADADVAATVTSAPPTSVAAATAANPDRHPRRHLAVRKDPTGIAALLSIIWTADLKRTDGDRGIDIVIC